MAHYKVHSVEIDGEICYLLDGPQGRQVVGDDPYSPPDVYNWCIALRDAHWHEDTIEYQGRTRTVGHWLAWWEWSCSSVAEEIVCAACLVRPCTCEHEAVEMGWSYETQMFGTLVPYYLAHMPAEVIRPQPLW